MTPTITDLARAAVEAQRGINTYRNDAEASISDADYEDWEEDVERFKQAATPEAWLAMRNEVDALKASLRVNALRAGYDHADVDRVIFAIENPQIPHKATDLLITHPKTPTKET